ncbi:efflux RND transporter permease subunit [Patescibacteria group bacterium]
MKKATANRYLSKLGFKKEFYSHWYAKYLINIRLVFLLILFIVPFGLFSLLRLPQRLNPEIKIPIINVMTVMPGAGPGEVEMLVTIPIEDAIKGVEKTSAYQSISQENVSVISIEFLSDVDPDEAKNDVQSAIDSVSNLPDEALDSSVTALDFENVPVLTFAIVSNNDDPTSLNLFAESLKDKLESDKTIKEVDITGAETQEIQILMKPEIVSTYQINPFQLSSQIKAGLSSYPSGNTVTDRSNIPVSVAKTLTSIEDIRSMPILINRSVVNLGDIADVVEVSAPNQFDSFIGSAEQSAKKSVSFGIYKTRSATIKDAAMQANIITNKEIEQFEDRFSLYIVENSAEEIQEEFSGLYGNFAQTLVLVFITLFLFLGIRQSLIVSFSIPITFLISFIVMQASGITLNFLSVFSLLIALGLLVDDAIVIVSAMTAYYRTGKYTAKETGILVWKDFIIPIWSTTITTVWAFIPLLLATGIIGEFIKTIPIVVSATLIASTSVAVLITLPMTMQVFDLKAPKRVIMLRNIVLLVCVVGLFAFVIPKVPMALYIGTIIIFLLFVIVVYDLRLKLHQTFIREVSKYMNIKKRTKQFNTVMKQGIFDSTRISNLYLRIITKTLQNKTYRNQVIWMTIGFAIFSYALVPIGLVQNEFFPKIDSDRLYVSLELSSGTKRESTTKEALEILDTLRNKEYVEYAVVDIGKSAASFNFGVQGGENTARVSLALNEHKKQSSIDIATELRDEFSTYTNGNVSIVEQSGGPPVGADLQITVLGNDFELLDTYANDLKQYIEAIDGTTDVNMSIKPSISKLSFVPDSQRMIDLGSSNDQIGFWLRSYASGFTLAKARLQDEEIDVKFRMVGTSPTPEELESLTVPTKNGYIPLSGLGSFHIEPNPSFITRENGKRSISVMAGVEAGYNTSSLNTDIESYADQLQLKDGYEWKTGGVNEENDESIASIFRAMIISSILILGTMVIQLGSFRKSIIVFLVIPLAISGVFIMFGLTGTPLSFPALIGVLALFGIVVNNSIVIVEKINQNLAANIPFTEAITDACASRVEPIMFSSLTTIMGLFPITVFDPMWRGLGGAIISGLTVSGVIMLLFIPSVYYAWYEGDYIKKKHKKAVRGGK